MTMTFGVVAFVTVLDVAQCPKRSVVGSNTAGVMTCDTPQQE